MYILDDVIIHHRAGGRVSHRHERESIDPIPPPPA